MGGPSNRDHCVLAIAFRLAIMDCTCGETIQVTGVPGKIRDEQLAAAFREHRKEFGLRSKSVGETIGKRLGSKHAIGVAFNQFPINGR